MNVQVPCGPQGKTLDDIALDFDLSFARPDPAQLGRLHTAGSYWLWSQVYPGTADLLRLYEWSGSGIVDRTTDHYSLQTIRAGVPHHLEGLFDYWLISDADHLWLQMPEQECRRYVLIAGGKSGVNRAHSLAWYCRECGTALGQPEPLRHDGTPAGFVRAQAAAVRVFNADASRRTCVACGSIHPAASDEAFGVGEEVLDPGSTRLAGLAQLDEIPVGAPLARLSDLQENTPRVVRTGGQEIVLVRTADEVRALSGICPHKGGPLGSGEVRSGTIVCPWHRFRYDLATGCSATNPALSAPVFEVAVRGDEIYLVLPE